MFAVTHTLEKGDLMVLQDFSTAESTWLFSVSDAARSTYLRVHDILKHKPEELERPCS